MFNVCVCIQYNNRRGVQQPEAQMEPEPQIPSHRTALTLGNSKISEVGLSDCVSETGNTEPDQ